MLHFLSLLFSCVSKDMIPHCEMDNSITMIQHPLAVITEPRICHNCDVKTNNICDMCSENLCVNCICKCGY